MAGFEPATCWVVVLCAINRIARPSSLPHYFHLCYIPKLRAG